MGWNFRNYRGHKLELYFWEADKTFSFGLGESFTWDNNRRIGNDVRGGNSYFGRPRAHHAIEDGRGGILFIDSQTPELKLFVEGADLVGPYHIQNGKHYILKDLESPLLNVEDALSAMEKALGLPVTSPGRAIPAPGRGGLGSESQVALSVASALLTGLATGMGAAGKLFAVPAGGAALLNAVLGLAIGSFEPETPAPPTLGEITQAVTDITRVLLREQSARDNAQHATTIIDNTVEHFAGLLYDFTPDPDSEQGASGKGGKKYGFDDTTASEVAEVLHDSMDTTRQGSFAYWLTFVSAHPDVGMLMLPSYLSGISMWAVLRRTQLGLHYGSERGRTLVRVSEINSYIDQLEEFRSGLLSAMKAYSGYRSAKLKEVKMDGLRESIRLIKRMGEAFLGDPLAIPHPMYKTYKSDDDFASAEGSGWNYDLAAGSGWLREPGYFERDSKGQVIKAQPPLDPYGKALGDLRTMINLLKDDATGVARGEWPERLLPVKAAS